MLTIDQMHTPTFFTSQKAFQLAKQLNAANDDWTYEPVHSHLEYWTVQVFDEDGVYVDSF